MRRAIQVAVLALLLATVGTQRSDATIERSSLTPDAPGTYIWVGGHRLHLNCSGEGSPTVIFDSGLGGSSLDWVRVQPRVASFTRACSYDRAGYGWSDSGPLPRDSEKISRELETLLGNASVPAPYLLVGHSFGGLNVRLYSHRNPHKVAGLVLVDSSHEDQYRRFEAAGIKSSAPRSNSFIVGNAFQIPDAMPDDIASVAQWFASSHSSMTAFLSELRHIRDSAEQLQDAWMPPDIPIIVISHRVDRAGDAPERSPRARIWMEMQSDLANRSANGRHVIATTDDHYVHLSQPQLVVESIRAVIEGL